MDYLEQFINDRGLRKRTARNYRSIIHKYEEYCGMNINDLIEEADFEEEQGIRWKKRTLKNRLVGFRNTMSQEVSKNTLISYINGVKAVYRHFEIEILQLPPTGLNQWDYAPARFEDFLTNADLKKVYDYSDRITRAMVLFMATSGVTRYDACYNITVNDFLEACKEYTTKEDLHEQLQELYKQQVIPTFYLQRQKTGKYFYTFCTPEATREIIRYLMSRRNLKITDRLFKIHDLTFGKRLIKLNDRLKLGKVGAFRKLRPHALRKYHATTLLNSKNFTIDEVDALQGRSKDSIHTAYFRNDPKILKEQYTKCIELLTIADTLQYEYDKLVQEKESLENKIDDQDILIREILDTQKEMQRLME